MPLIKSGSKAAVSENIRREMSSGKGQKQAIAIALDIARKARADGGETEAPLMPWAQTETGKPVTVLAHRGDGSSYHCRNHGKEN